MLAEDVCVHVAVGVVGWVNLAWMTMRPFGGWRSAAGGWGFPGRMYVSTAGCFSTECQKETEILSYVFLAVLVFRWCMCVE